MPLSASIGFFSPFHYKKKLIHQSFSPHISSFSSSILLHFRETSFGTYIRNLALFLKDNKNQRYIFDFSTILCEINPK